MDRMFSPRGGRTATRAGAAAVLALLLAAAAPAAPPVALPAGAAPAYAIGYGAPGADYTAVDASNPLPIGGKQESFALVTANIPAVAATVYGGDYILAQSCATYGTVTLRARGPDGATMVPLIVKSGADTAGGTGVTLGSNAVVAAAVSGTTGCNATLTRIP